MLPFPGFFNIPILIVVLGAMIYSSSNDIDDALIQIEKESGCKMRVTSGYRTKKHNKKVGGARRSYHLTDRARDIVPKVPGCISFVLLGKIACRLTSTIIYSNHVHIDNRTTKLCVRSKK